MSDDTFLGVAGESTKSDAIRRRLDRRLDPIALMGDRSDGATVVLAGTGLPFRARIRTASALFLRRNALNCWDESCTRSVLGLTLTMSSRRPRCASNGLMANSSQSATMLAVGIGTRGPIDAALIAAAVTTSARFSSGTDAWVNRRLWSQIGARPCSSSILLYRSAAPGRAAGIACITR